MSDITTQFQAETEGLTLQVSVPNTTLGVDGAVMSTTAPRFSLVLQHEALPWARLATIEGTRFDGRDMIVNNLVRVNFSLTAAQAEALRDLLAVALYHNKPDEVAR